MRKQDGQDKIGIEGRVMFHGVAALSKNRLDVPFDQVGGHVGSLAFEILDPGGDSCGIILVAVGFDMISEAGVLLEDRQNRLQIR